MCRIHHNLIQAEREAKRSRCSYRHGAVAVNGRKILGRAVNSEKTHPLTAIDDFIRGIHSEIAAALEVPRAKLAGCTIYTVRVLRNGDWGLAAPCSICRNVLARFGVAKVVYSIAPAEYGVIDLRSR